MKSTYALLFSLFLVIQLPATAQDMEKMNKNELREYAIVLLGKIDSLNTQIGILQASEKQLTQALATSEEKNKVNLGEIQKLTALAAKTQKELDRVRAEKEAVITTLNKDVLLLRDSITTLQTALLTDTSSPAADGNDFLNSYFFKPFPLENNSFSLVLSKVIFGTSNNSNNNNNRKWILQVAILSTTTRLTLVQNKFIKYFRIFKKTINK